MTQEKTLQILQSGKNVFLTGEPGSGKTFTINQFTEYLSSKNIPYAVTASTGIAATHINGTTIHSWSGIRIKKNLTDRDVENILSNEFQFKKISRAKVLIIDEVSMLDGQLLDDLQKVLSATHGILNDKPFGGIQVVLVGDFFQLPPVSRDGKAKFAFEASIWDKAGFQVCYLTEQHRQSDKKYLEVLSAIRQLRVQPKHKKTLSDNVPASKPSTELFTHNKDVDDMNVLELGKINADQKNFVMASSGIPFLVENLKKSCLSPEILSLKVGAVVMFTKNKFDDGVPVYVNGTIGKVVRFENSLPVVKITDGDEINVESAEWKIEEYKNVKAKIVQLPLRLAWAITVHKSQGMSLDSAKIDLSNAFDFGQGYVALSRVRSLSGLLLTGYNDRAFEMHPKVIAQDNIFREQSDLIDI